MNSITSTTRQLKIEQFGNETAQLSQGDNKIVVDIKKLNRDESLIIIEAVMRMLEPTMSELQHMREVYITPQISNLNVKDKSKLI